MTSALMQILSDLLHELDQYADLPTKVQALNLIRDALHKVGPFNSEPVDCIYWVPCEEVVANDYNPNVVAPPEMELLKVSIEADGYTQPIVVMPLATTLEVVDGFHRNRIGRENETIKNRLHGHLPVVKINQSRADKGDRIAATIRHNRARGKHVIEKMADIVVELRRRNWSEERIAKELGMDSDEVLRLCQITGLTEVFKDAEFSKAWEFGNEDIDVSEIKFENETEDQ